MLYLFVNCLIVSSIFYIYGTLFKFKFENCLGEVTQSILLGVILISFLSLLVNFFLPLNDLFGNFFLFLSLIFFFVHLTFSKKKRKILISIFFVSLIACIFIAYDTINRPDAGLYHLPYVQILNENKIIIGLTNLHFRFGHISSIQYLSAVLKNSYMPIEAINLPTAILVSSFLIYLISYFDNKFKNHEIKLFIFLIIIYCMYSFNRFSNFGNDASAHIYVFLYFLYFIQIDFKKITNSNISLLYSISIFLFTQKIFMGFFVIITFFIFIYKLIHKKEVWSFKLILPSLFLILWLTKNILVSGCAVYPIQKTCLKNLSHTNLENTKKIEIESEAWTKDWSNQNNIADYQIYIKDFNWIKTWSNNHLSVIKNKVIPYILLIILFLIYSLIFFKKKKQDKFKKPDDINKKFFYIFFIGIFISIIWFLKFPLYRYGQSFLMMPLMSFFFYIIYYFVDYKRLIKPMKYIIATLFIVIISKNFFRIYEKNNIRNVWPNIYTLSEFSKDNIKPHLEAVYRDNKFIYYYSPKGECMYSSAPCSNFNIKNLYKLKINGYDLFYLNYSHEN